VIIFSQTALRIYPCSKKICSTPLFLLAEKGVVRKLHERCDAPPHTRPFTM
jgi:hypothetical protein